MPTSTDNKTAGSLRDAMIIGSTWMVAMHWVMGGMALVSVAILARLLLPEDFGLIAMSALFIGLITVLTSFGVDLVLIQRSNVTREHFDAAWTLQLMQMAAVASCVVLVAPLAVNYFNEPRVRDVMILLAVGIGLSGLRNIGVVAFRKELEFAKEFGFQVSAKLGSIVATLALAVWWRNYWALAWGIVSGQLINVALSYTLHPYRPRISFAKIPEIWSFSQWLLLSSIGMYVRKGVDAFVVGRFFSSSEMGLYSVSRELAALPTTELVWPMSRALFPGYAKLAHDPERLGRAYLKVLSTITLIGMPAGAGLAAVADPLVLVVFGSGWVQAVPILPWLAIYSIFLTVSGSVHNVLMALGRMRRLVGLVWTQMLLVVPLIVLSAQYRDVVIIAQAQVLATILVLPLFFHAVTSISIVSWGEIAGATWRPLVASLVMTLCLFLLGGEFSDSPLLRLGQKVLVGVVSFTTLNYVLWRISGQPDGGERVVVDVVSQRLTWLRSASGTSR